MGLCIDNKINQVAGRNALSFELMFRGVATSARCNRSKCVSMACHPGGFATETDRQASSRMRKENLPIWDQGVTNLVLSTVRYCP
jgi:hypothetical protein